MLIDGRGDPCEWQEREVLGGVLRWPACLDDLATVLRAEDFTQAAHADVWRALLALWDARKPVDLASLANELQARGQMQSVGGYAALARLWDETASGANAAYYARLVRQRSVVWRLHGLAGELARDTADWRRWSGDDASALLEWAERNVLAISEVGAGGVTHELPQILNEACDRIDARSRQAGGLGLPTGFPALDSLLGGLQPGELVVVAARPSVGKTALGTAIARNAGVGVFFASLEQSRHELGDRLLSSEARVDGHSIRSGRPAPAAVARITQARVHLSAGVVMHVDDGSRQNCQRIAANARRLRRQHGIGLVVVDYLQLVDPDDRKAPRHEQVGSVSRRLKGLARELNVPVVAMAQLSRSADGERPRLSHLRESGSIEADADVVMLMHREEHRPDEVEVNVAKQRNGPTGCVTLRFRREFTRFEDGAVMPPLGE